MQKILKYISGKGKFDSLNHLLDNLVLNDIRIVSAVPTRYYEKNGAKMCDLVDLRVNKCTVIVEITPDDVEKLNIIIKDLS